MSPAIRVSGGDDIVNVFANERATISLGAGHDLLQYYGFKVAACGDYCQGMTSHIIRDCSMTLSSHSFLIVQLNNGTYASMSVISAIPTGIPGYADGNDVMVLTMGSVDDMACIAIGNGGNDTITVPPNTIANEGVAALFGDSINVNIMYTADIDSIAKTVMWSSSELSGADTITSAAHHTIINGGAAQDELTCTGILCIIGGDATHGQLDVVLGDIIMNCEATRTGPATDTIHVYRLNVVNDIEDGIIQRSVLIGGNGGDPITITNANGQSLVCSDNCNGNYHTFPLVVPS
jgi:hypothetical protein